MRTDVNSEVAARRALLDQKDAEFRTLLAGWPSEALLADVDELLARPARVSERWEFAAHAMISLLLEEVQRRDERRSLAMEDRR